MKLKLWVLTSGLSLFSPPWSYSQALLSQRDIDILPSALTSADVVRKWGEPAKVSPSLFAYPADFSDFEYLLSIDEPESGGNVTAIHRREVGISSYLRTVWLSDVYFPYSKATLVDIKNLPAVSTLKTVEKEVGCGKMRKLSSAVGLAGSRAPVCGYTYEFYFHLPLSEQTSSSPKLVSAYIVSDVARKLCWGQVIDPTTGELQPERVGDPFKDDGRRGSFLYPHGN